MKKKQVVFGAALLLCLVSIFVSLGAYVFAQPSAPVSVGPVDKLAGAIALLNGDQPQKAHEALAAIGENDPEFGAAQCYDALSLYKLKDYHGFYRAAESLDLQVPGVSPEVRAELAHHQVEVLFYFRRFDDIFPKVQAFGEQYPGSGWGSAVAEYRMAALYERGLKKAIETVNLDADHSKERWAEARTNLEQFLSVAATAAGTNYSCLTNRLLQEDVWSAHIVLGEDKAALAAIAPQDVAGRERVSFLRIQINAERLHKDQVDQNLKLMSDYLEAFPAGVHRPRVVFDFAELNFKKGKQLINEAEVAGKIGDVKTTQLKQVSAHQYFQQMRSRQSQIATNSALGLKFSDVLDFQDDLLETYYLEKDYATLLPASTSMAAHYAPGDIGWMIARLYYGVVLVNQSPPNPAGAMAVFDGIIAQGFTGKPDHDHWVADAARWRIYLAQRANDRQKAVSLVVWVNGSDCKKNIKTEFLKSYGVLAGLPQK